MPAAALALAAMLPAQAAIVVGTFDPAFGPLIPNLGFRGTVSVQVPDACFALPADFIANANACSGNSMAVLAASVDLYNTTTPGQPSLLNLVFTLGAGSVNGVVTGFSGTTGQNELLGVDTVLSNTLFTGLFDAGTDASPVDDIAFNGSLQLRLFAIDPAAQVTGNEPFYGAILYACTDLDEGGNTSGCADSRPAPIIFGTRSKPLPEPGSLPLLTIGALAMMALRRRRSLRA